MDQVINYARNPKKTTERSCDELAALHSIDGVVEYAADDMKTEYRIPFLCVLSELQRDRRCRTVNGNQTLVG